MEDEDFLDKYPEGNYVVVTGSVLGGFEFWGPFTTMRSACEWVDSQHPLIGNVTIISVKPKDDWPWKDSPCQDTTTDLTSTVE